MKLPWWYMEAESLVFEHVSKQAWNWAEGRGNQSDAEYLRCLDLLRCEYLGLSSMNKVA